MPIRSNPRVCSVFPHAADQDQELLANLGGFARVDRYPLGGTCLDRSTLGWHCQHLTSSVGPFQDAAKGDGVPSQNIRTRVHGVQATWLTAIWQLIRCLAHSRKQKGVAVTGARALPLTPGFRQRMGDRHTNQISRKAQSRFSKHLCLQSDPVSRHSNPSALQSSPHRPGILPGSQGCQPGGPVSVLLAKFPERGLGVLGFRNGAY